MMSIIIGTPHEIADNIAKRAKEKRLSLNLSQQTLSEKSGVSYGVLKKFEQTGQISLGSLLKLALVLEALNDFEQAFTLNRPEEASSLDELMKDSPRKTRKRGRK